MNSDKEPYTINYERIAHETTAAWLIVFDDDMFNPKKEWLPKSQCEIDENAQTIDVPEWLAFEKDLL